MGATMYIDSHNRTPDEKYNSSSYIFSCDWCGRVMINAGIEYVVYRIDDVVILDHLPTMVELGALK